MWTLTCNQTINISHHLALDYESKSSHNHGHILNVKVELFSTRLNYNNMIIDCDKVCDVIKKLEGDIDYYMINNNMKGNPTLENIILIVKTKLLMLLQKENEKCSTNVLLTKIIISDESGRVVVYNMQ